MRYEIKHTSEELNKVYVVVYPDDGGSFGQYIDPGSVEEMDRQVIAAVERVTGQAQAAKALAEVQIGVERVIS